MPLRRLYGARAAGAYQDNAVSQQMLARRLNWCFAISHPLGGASRLRLFGFNLYVLGFDLQSLVMNVEP